MGQRRTVLNEGTWTRRSLHPDLKIVCLVADHVSVCRQTPGRDRVFTASANSSSSTHSSHLRLIGRGVPGLSFDFTNVQFLCDFPQENPRFPNNRPRD